MKPIVIKLTQRTPQVMGLTQIKKGRSVNLQTLKQVITRVCDYKTLLNKERWLTQELYSSVLLEKAFVISVGHWATSLRTPHLVRSCMTL